MGLDMRSYLNTQSITHFYALVIGLIAYLVDVLGTFSPIAGNLQTLIEDCTL